MSPKITPHKGGRGERMQIRLSTEEKGKLEQLAAHHDCSMADVIIKLINQDFENLIAYVGRNDPAESD